MALSLGATTPTALYLGTTAISAAYLGVTQVYTTGGGDAYAIGGASPELVAAFTTQSDGTTAGEYYRKASSETTFSGLFTHSVSGPLTMFDSSGTLVWAPHNLMDGSHNFDNETYWFSSNLTEAAATTDGPDGSTKMWALTDADGANYGQLSDVGSVAFPSTATAHVCEFWLTKDEDETRFPCMSVNGTNDFFIHINTKTGAHVFEWNTASATASVTEAVTGLWRVRVTFQARGASDIVMFPARGTVIGTPSTAATGTAEFGFLTFYRADLPMADNPDMPAGLEKYVPTTTAAVYGPRRQAYRYNSGWELAGMQMEAAAATNLLASSQDMDGTGWLTPTATLTDAAATGPDGTASLQNLLDDSASVLQRVIARVTASAGTDICASCYVAKDNDETRFPEFFIYDGLNGRAWHLNTKTGATALRTSAGSPTNATISVIDSGNFWRVALTMQVGTGRTAIDFQIRPAAGTVFGTYTDSATGSINAGFVQMETGLVPTSYIPTNGSTVTRAAETLTIAGADTPFNTTGFTIYEKGFITYADNNSGLEAQLARINQDANNNHEWRLSTASTATGIIQVRVEAGGTIDVSQTTNELTPGVNTAFAVASRYTSSELQVALNGTTSTADTSIPSITDMSATAFEPLYNFNGYISELRYWGTDLAESGIAEVTT